MNFITRYFDTIKSFFNQIVIKLSTTIFGANNERLDFIIDSFNRLQAKQQKLVFTGGIILAASLVLVVFSIYFIQVGKLKKELETSMQSLRELSTLSEAYQRENSRFAQITQQVKTATQNLTSLKSYFEEVSRNEEINLGSLNEKVIPLPESNTLSQHLSQIRVDVNIDNISLPKILKYITTLERSRKKLSVSHLSIRSRYETKLYFDTKISVRGYTATTQQP
ncbi:MAG: hypothetical protein OXC44_03960 [Proteobacteria bacterium]|nr:hypothetical protein [Pseudomonadota bacterium]